MKKPKKIPIKAAKEIAALGYDEVIIVGCNYETGIQHVTTYGKSIKACENAAAGGNSIKRLLQWPEDMCNAAPARVKKRNEKLKWTDDDMVRYASKCHYSSDETVAYSDLLTEYEQFNPKTK